MHCAKHFNSLFNFAAFPFGLDLAAINIQRGRDHGLPSYTQWREPCGLTPISDWDDLERVIGPKSAHRMRLAYKSIDDIDLFVGGLAERPVVGGLVGPVFACIIAQQFSNLRRGDRFWYENGDFESSFTPAQLQSIRQVNFAQVLCRTLGSGTLQPHPFLPHTVPTNERVQCDTGSLTPIDLKPWLERDPFLKNAQSATDADPTRSVVKSNDGRPSMPSVIQTIKTNDKIVIQFDLPPSDKPIGIRIQNEPLIVNGTIVNNKLDLDTIRSHFDSVRPSNIITNKKHTLTKTQATKTQTNRNKKRKTTNTTTTTTTTVKPNTSSTKRTKKRKNHNRRKHKRDVSDVTDEKARSSIVIKIDKPTEETSTQKTPFNGVSSKRRIDKDSSDKKPDNQYVIVTPDQNLYDIEIKIKPKPSQTSQTNEKIIVQTSSNNRPNDAYDNYNNIKISTKRPQQFYEIAQPSLSDAGQYNIQNEPIKPPQQPTYNFDTYRPQSVFVKRTTTTTTTRPTTTTRRPYIYNNNAQQDEQTSRPYYTTKKPFHGYGSNEPDLQNDDQKPFYSFPTVQNTDSSSYYSASNTNNNDEFVSVIQNSKPYQTKPQFDNFYSNRPSAVKPSTSNDNYGQYDDEKPVYSQSVRPPQNDYHNSDYGPTYLDEFTTKRPTKLTTTYAVLDDDDYFDSDQNGYGSVTTNRPHDLTTFYTVQTTRKKKRTTRRTTTIRPTRPLFVYNQNDEDNDNDDDDDNDDDEDDESSVGTGYFNPSSVLSNIVNTFNGYFGSPSTTTTTRKPYITQQDDFYTYPSLPGDFPYSRQKDTDTTKKTHIRIARSNTDFSNTDYEETTYPSALNVDYNNDDIVDDTKDIAFDRDGYLRPEYMRYDSQHKMNTNSNYKLNTDTNAKIDTNKDMHTTFMHAMTNATVRRIHHLLNGYFQNNRHHKQITTLTDANRNKGQSVRFKAIPTNRPLVHGLVPLNVLTKPER